MQIPACGAGAGGGTAARDDGAGCAGLCVGAGGSVGAGGGGGGSVGRMNFGTSFAPRSPTSFAPRHNCNKVWVLFYCICLRATITLQSGAVINESTVLSVPYHADWTCPGKISTVSVSGSIALRSALALQSAAKKWHRTLLLSAPYHAD